MLKVIDFDNLMTATERCKRNVMHKDSVAGYVNNRLQNAYALQSVILSGKYDIYDYIKFVIYEPKQRDIISTRMRDRVFQRAFSQAYLCKTLTRSFIAENTSCQKGKGTDYSRDLFKKQLYNYYMNYGTDGWVLVLDIHNFFGSTPHDVAMNAVTKAVRDNWARGEVKRIIDSYNFGEDPNIGLGLGSEIVPMIESAILSPIDHAIKERLKLKYYNRYADDFRIISHDKEKLLDTKYRIEVALSALGLEVNSKKTYLAPLSQAIKFLGFSFKLLDTGKIVIKPLPQKIYHEKRKLRKMIDLAKSGILTKQKVDECYISFRAGLLRGNASHGSICKMDEYYKNLWKYTIN